MSGISTGGDFRQSYLNGEEGFVSRILFIPSWGLPFNEEFAKDPYNPNGAFNQIEDFQRLGTNTFNPYAVLTGSGYFAFDNNVTESIINLNQKLDKITKGLSVRGVFGYTSNFSSVKFQTGSYAAYTLNRTTKQLSPSRNTFDAVLQGIRPQSYGDIKTTLQLFVNHERSFNKHNVASNIIVTRDLREIEGTGISAAPFANQGLVFNFTYNFDRKYFLQLNGAYNGSENYPVGDRYGIFPSLSAGYAISNEKFLKDVSWLDQLKIRGSVGLVGNPSPGGRFPYLDAYSRGGNVPLGDPNNPAQTPTYVHSQIGNSFFTWEKSLKRNIGVDVSVFKNKLSLTADVYDDKRYDILLARNNTSFATYGESLPRVNFGENYNRGYEFELTHQNQVNKFYYSINAQLSHNKNRINIADDPGRQPAYLNAVGQSIGQTRGYKVIGFYKDAADIAASSVNKLTSNVSIPGDLKYMDINEDGVITNLDQVPIGYSNIPEYVGGLNFSLGYKGLSLGVLFQGVENVSSDLIFDSQSGFQQSTNNIQSLNSFDYATLYNEALSNGGRPPIYDQAALLAYQNNSDPFNFPNNNYRNDFLKESAPVFRNILSASGGSNSFRYFTLLGYYNQKGNFKSTETDDFNSQLKFQRVNFRLNLDYDLNSNLTVGLNAAGRTGNLREPLDGASGLLSDLYNLPPNAFVLTP